MNKYTDMSVEAFLATGISAEEFMQYDAASYLIDFGDANLYRLPLRALIDIFMYVVISTAQGKDDGFAVSETTRLLKLMRASQDGLTEKFINDKEITAQIEDFIASITEASKAANDGKEFPETIKTLMEKYGFENKSWVLAFFISRVFIEKFGYAERIASDVAMHELTLKVGISIEDGSMPGPVPEENVGRVSMISNIFKESANGIKAQLTKDYHDVSEFLAKYVDHNHMSESLSQFSLPKKLALLMGVAQVLSTTYRLKPTDYKWVIETIYGVSFFDKLDDFEDMPSDDKKHFLDDTGKALGF